MMPLWVQPLNFHGPSDPYEEYSLFNDTRVPELPSEVWWRRLPTSVSSVSIGLTTFTSDRAHWGDAREAATLKQMILEAGTRGDLMLGFDVDIADGKRIACEAKSRIRFRRGAAGDPEANDLEAMQHVLTLSDFVKSFGSVCVEPRHSAGGEVAGPIGVVLASRHGRWIHSIIPMSRSYRVAKLMEEIRDLRLIAVDGSVVTRHREFTVSESAGIDITWNRVFHREWRERARGQERMNASDQYEEHFTVMVVYMSVSARTLGASKILLLWLKVEEYLMSVVAAGEHEAPAVIVFYPEAPWMIMECALAVNRKFGSHSLVAGDRRISEFLGRLGYSKQQPDVRGQAMVYMLDTVFERVPEDMAAGVVRKELELRRDILVSELGVYHSADPAWELPAMLSFRSADSADGCGSDGQVVREFVNSYGLTVWSPTDFPDGGTGATV